VTNPALAVPSGAPTPDDHYLSSGYERVDAGCNGGAGSVYFAGLTPGWVGLYQVNFTLPLDIPAGEVTCTLGMGMGSETERLTVFVAPGN
jgi:uncharacterized protein (TIGR03437 family)